jgi:hypothetical protein
MAQDQTVKGGTHLSLAHAGILHFTFLNGGRYFRNFPEINPVKKEKGVSRKDRIYVLRSTDLVLDHKI